MAITYSTCNLFWHHKLIIVDIFASEINSVELMFYHDRFVDGFGESGYAEQQCSPVQIGKIWYKLFLPRTNGVPWFR